MKNSRIVKAFDSINPTQAEKERMLHAILSEQVSMPKSTKNTGAVYTTQRQPRKRGWISILASAAACLVMVVFGVSALLAENTPAPAMTEPTMNTEVEIDEIYADVIEKYSRAISENWDADRCTQEGISVRAAWIREQQIAPGYALLDLNGDALEELLIMNGSNIWELYTQSETSLPMSLFRDTSDGTNYHLCEHGILAEEYYGKTEGHVTYYRIEANGLVEQESLKYREDVWHWRKGKQQWEPISAETAGEITNQHPYVDVNLTIFDSVPDYLVDKSDAPEVYMLVLENYRTALIEEWDPGTCVSNGISLMIGYYGELYDSLGYAIMDLDSNGVYELLITDGNYIYDLYTIVDDEEYGPLRLLTGSERITYNLMEGNVIFNWGSGGAAVSYYTFSKLSGRDLVVQEGYVFDSDLDPDHPWFYYDGENRGEPCGDFDAEAVVNGGYTTLEIPFTPFE